LARKSERIREIGSGFYSFKQKLAQNSNLEGVQMFLKSGSCACNKFGDGVLEESLEWTWHPFFYKDA
jgi:hypothetical protein